MLFRTLVTASAIALIASPSFADDPPAPTAFPAGADSLVSAISALTTAEADQIGLSRSTQRYRDIRGKLVDAIIDSKGEGELAGLKFDATRVLCDARRDYVELAAQQNFLSSVTTELKKTATTAKVDSLTAAILTLFKTQSVKITSSPNDLKKAKQAAVDGCNNDFTQYANTYYSHLFGPVQVGLEDFLSPFSSLIKLIVDIVTPVAEAGAKLVDAEVRKQAIQTYLKKPEVRAQIAKAAATVNSELSSALNANRYNQLGKYVEQAVDLNSIKFDLTKEASCKSAFNGGNLIVTNNRPSDSFVKCAAVISAAYADKIAALLKTADAYDKLADAPPDLTGTKLKAITDTLDQIANGTVPKAKLEDLWNKAVEIIGFAQTVIAAASNDNRDKIQKQIDALVKAL